MKPGEFAKELIQLIDSGNRIFVFGNGGSFTNACHFATDLSVGGRNSCLLWPIYTLGTQQAIFTANSNDIGFEEAIAIEIRTFGHAGDLFLGISTSGKSKNIINAIRECQKRGIKSYLLTSENFSNNYFNASKLIKVGIGKTHNIEQEHFQYLSETINYIKNFYLTSNNMRRAIFIDRDGTVIPESVDGKQINPDKILPDVSKMLKSLKKNGFMIILISNQSIVGRGELTIDKHWHIHNLFERRLNQDGIYLNDYYYCFHKRDSACDCRKPNPGSFIRAAEEWNIDLKFSFMIGNQLSDVDAGNKAGCESFLMKFDEDNRNWISQYDPLDILNIIMKKFGGDF